MQGHAERFHAVWMNLDDGENCSLCRPDMQALAGQPKEGTIGVHCGRTPPGLQALAVVAVRNGTDRAVPGELVRLHRA